MSSSNWEDGTPMRGLLRRLCLTIVTGYIFVYYSEYAFWARPLANIRLPDALWLLLTYSFAAYVFLTLAVTLRVRSFAAIFVVGALFGWLVEGVFVQTMYSLLPFRVCLTNQGSNQRTIEASTNIAR